jgi:glycine/D-amino acid oxidase-like deaminating enzyme
MSADVAIVGAGIVGLTCAAYLAERGLEVVLLEKDDIGFEQSGRSTAAVTLPARTNENTSSPVDKSRSLPVLAAQEWQSFEQRWDCSIELNSEGWLSMAVDDADISAWDRDKATYLSLSGGKKGTELAAPAARERFPSLLAPSKP